MSGGRLLFYDLVRSQTAQSFVLRVMARRVWFSGLSTRSLGCSASKSRPSHPLLTGHVTQCGRGCLRRPLCRGPTLTPPSLTAWHLVSLVSSSRDQWRDPGRFDCNEANPSLQLGIARVLSHSSPPSFPRSAPYIVPLISQPAIVCHA